MNVLLDYQIILLPKKNYWKWVRACSSYVMRFGANLTDDPSTAMGYMAPGQVITFPSGEGLFPEHADVAAWLQDAAPGVRLDPLDAKTPKEFRASLKKRIETDDRYGQKQRPFYLVWPTDYPVITQAFGANPQIYTRFGMPGHEGLDIRALTNTSVYSCADGSVYEVHTNPKDHPYGIHVRVRHKDGYRTVYGHLLRALVSVGESVKAGQVLGKADSTGASTAAHLHLTLERDGATARKETKYPKDVVDPTPFMVWPDRSSKKGLPSEVWPAGRCLIGAYGGLGRPLSKDEISLVRTAGLEAVKVDGHETPDNLAELRQIRPGMLLVSQLADDLSGDKVGPADFVGRVEGELSQLAEAGVSHFEVSAQPNLQLGGWCRSWRDGHEFSAWFEEVVGLLRRLAPEARFGFPGLAPGADVVGWRGDSDRFLSEAEDALTAADWIGIDVYGGPNLPHWERDLARTLAAYRSRFPGKLLFITQVDMPGSAPFTGHQPEPVIAFFRRLRREPSVGAAFCGGFAMGPEADLAALGDARPWTQGIAEAVGQRSF
jgi:hypothetical protein